MMHRGPRKLVPATRGQTVLHTARTRGRETFTLNRVVRWESKALSVVGDAWDHPSTGHGKGVVAPGKGTRQCPGPFELSPSTVRLNLWRIILDRRGLTRTL